MDSQIEPFISVLALLMAIGCVVLLWMLIYVVANEVRGIYKRKK